MKSRGIKGQNTISLTKKRILIISIGFSLFTVYLFLNLFNLQVIEHEKYRDKVFAEITTSSKLIADRGNIYDSNMTVLATTNTVWRVFVSTRDIKLAEKEIGKNYSLLIASGLSNILNLNEHTILAKLTNSSVLDVTIKKSVSYSEYASVLNFILKNRLEKLVFTEAQSSRYYPESALAAHVIGFTGSDNQGLYGLEYYYESTLKGNDGYYLYSKDANGNALDTGYSSYVPAEDGYSIVTTIDAYVQSALEDQLERIVANHGVENRVTGIVMNTTTGAILAMATSSPFDPNTPYVLDSLSQQKLASMGFDESSEEYKKYKKELLEIMWSNKAVSETYEPGSTFKIITVATALDCGAASLSDRFSCHGYHEVGGWKIKCHKVTGHGSGFTLDYGLQMSCNPAMMQIAERIGAETFYDYIEGFGYFEKSGIDLPSEASTIFHELDNIGSTELATISFGQRFKVTAINHLRAIAAVANGGYLVTPHIVDKVIDSNGNIISTHVQEPVVAVISKNTADVVSDILEKGVSGNGGAKNAGVEGYKVAAKTGTSQKFDILDENGNSYLRIGSTVAYAPSDESGIAVIIIVDEPTSSVKYGSVVAAPYVSCLLDNILPYLEYESAQQKEEILIEDYVGKEISVAEKMLAAAKLEYEIIGDGNVILSQIPSAGTALTSNTPKLILYTSEMPIYTTIPNFVGKDIAEATEIALNAGLNIRIIGAGGGTVTKQSLPLGAIVKRGEVINLTTLITDFED